MLNFKISKNHDNNINDLPHHFNCQYYPLGQIYISRQYLRNE